MALGAAQTVDPREASVREMVMDATRGEGAAVAFEAAGSASALRDCLAVVSPGGAVVLVGVAPAATQLAFDVYPFHRKNLRLVGSYGGSSGIGFTAATRWLAALELGPLIGQRFPLPRIGEAFEAAGRGDGLKVLVNMARE